MPPQAQPPRLTAAVPSFACPGGVVHIEGNGLTAGADALPEVRIGDEHVQVIAASSTRLTVVVGEQVAGGTVDVHVTGVTGTAPLTVGRPIATGVHQVDSPVIDRLGNVYATFSGARGQRV